MKYHPAELISELKVPTLILQGDNDIQVTADQAELLHVAKPDSKLVIVKKMNHVLKSCEYDKQANLATYQNPSLPVSPELLTAISDFVTSKK